MVKSAVVHCSCQNGEEDLTLHAEERNCPELRDCGGPLCLCNKALCQFPVWWCSPMTHIFFMVFHSLLRSLGHFLFPLLGAPLRPGAAEDLAFRTMPLMYLLPCGFLHNVLNLWGCREFQQETVLPPTLCWRMSQIFVGQELSS